MAAVEGCEDPWLGRVEIDALDTLAPGKELPLYLQRHGISDCYSPCPIHLWGELGKHPACKGSDLEAAAPMRLGTMPGVSAAPLKLFDCSRTGPEAVELGCAYLDVEPHAGQVLSISWLGLRRGQLLVVDSRFTVGRMSMADEPTWMEGVSLPVADRVELVENRTNGSKSDAGRMRCQGP